MGAEAITPAVECLEVLRELAPGFDVSEGDLRHLVGAMGGRLDADAVELKFSKDVNYKYTASATFMGEPNLTNEAYLDVGGRTTGVEGVEIEVPSVEQAIGLVRDALVGLLAKKNSAGIISPGSITTPNRSIPLPSGGNCNPGRGPIGTAPLIAKSLALSEPVSSATTGRSRRSTRPSKGGPKQLGLFS